MIYLDHAATTKPEPEVVQSMATILNEDFGNASSIHELGRTAKAHLVESRQIAADFLGCNPEEIIFTSGGTESVNLALLGLVNNDKQHIITTNIEHSASNKTFQYLEAQGYQVTYLPVDSSGLVSIQQIQDAITPNTGLISVIFANNEIGTIQPINEISAIAKQNNIPFFTDACQAAPYIDLRDCDVTAVCLSGSKIYGPKGVGLLYVKEGTNLNPQMHGGDQEDGKRAGTENLPAIVGLATALKITQQKRDQDAKLQTELRDALIQSLLSSDYNIRLNGDSDKRLANNINISIEGLEGESLLLRLNDNNIYVSTGSACSSANLEPSHVLQAIGLSKNEVHSSLRISLGRYTDASQIEHFQKVLFQVIEDINQVSQFL